jgi:hypothetical protein
MFRFLIIIFTFFSFSVQSEDLLEKWAKENPWFGANTEMTEYVLKFDEKIQAQGINPESEEYFNMLDNEVRKAFPEYCFTCTDESKQEYTLTVDGSDLIFKGSIEANLYLDMKSTLIANPSVTRLILDSEGGLEDTAFDVSDLIIDFELDTHAIYCESSCTILFVSGNKRTLQRGRKIGFHRTYWDTAALEDYYRYFKDEYNNNVFDFTSWVYDDAQETIFKKMQFFIERGIEPLFIIKTLQTKSEGMWFPRRKELLNANFITE